MLLQQYKALTLYFDKEEMEMSYLYINENGATVKINGNRLSVQYQDGLLRELPLETLDGITVLNTVQISGKAIQVFLQNGIPVLFFSKGGKYFGRLQSTGHMNASRQRQQAKLYNTSFALELSKQLIMGKIHNQEVILRRYGKSTATAIHPQIITIQNCRKKIALADSIEEIMGFEGYAARTYFSTLSELIKEEFHFHGRNRQPPKDEFNSMISLGYAVLMNIIYGSIEARGLNPYFGFLHRDKEKHPTLASDLMEEWRAVLIDSTAMALVNGNEIHKEHFYLDIENGACLLTREGIRIFLKKLEEKLMTKVKYLQEVQYPVSFRQGISLQVDSLIRAIEAENPALYHPIQIR